MARPRRIGAYRWSRSGRIHTSNTLDSIFALCWTRRSVGLASQTAGWLTCRAAMRSDSLECKAYRVLRWYSLLSMMCSRSRVRQPDFLWVIIECCSSINKRNWLLRSNLTERFVAFHFPHSFAANSLFHKKSKLGECSWIFISRLVLSQIVAHRNLVHRHISTTGGESKNKTCIHIYRDASLFAFWKMNHKLSCEVFVSVKTQPAVVSCFFDLRSSVVMIILRQQQ